jgi:hypothetical protein
VNGTPKLERLLNNKINANLRGLQSHIKLGSNPRWESLVVKRYMKNKKEHDLHLVLQDQIVGGFFVSKESI